MTPKKEQELEYLHSFRYFCSDFPDGTIIPGETPDFIVAKEGYRIGIEITKIYSHSGRNKVALQAIEAARDRITTLAKQYAADLGVPPRAVVLFFNWTLPLYRNDEKRIACAVAQTVCDHLPEPDEFVDVECHSGSIQPREVDQILIYRVNPVEGYDWKWVEASRRIVDAVPNIIDAINRKSKSAIDCFQKCDECWLLIASGEPTLRASGNISPDATSINRCYDSTFTRTYFLDFGRGKLWQLKTDK